VAKAIYNVDLGSFNISMIAPAEPYSLWNNSLVEGASIAFRELTLSAIPVAVDADLAVVVSERPVDPLDQLGEGDGHVLGTGLAGPAAVGLPPAANSLTVFLWIGLPPAADLLTVFLWIGRPLTAIILTGFLWIGLPPAADSLTVFFRILWISCPPAADSLTVFLWIGLPPAADLLTDSLTDDFTPALAAPNSIVRLRKNLRPAIPALDDTHFRGLLVSKNGLGRLARDLRVLAIELTVSYG
jgi:hypothetical protein